ncbi:flagellar hook-length control protein FliK [Pseudorhodobacter aquimaris]|uniref:flagellar hook-length control protein FliK n=1 Tax=Pseudorhodobacter aquimaris TaxID=687412 RepID=UPI00067BC209|nr:flagellar hook-length control protein FliK [Pseudorhodobacter aquimaris]
MDNINVSGATVGKSHPAPVNQRCAQVPGNQDFAAFMQAAMAELASLPVTQTAAQAVDASLADQPLGTNEVDASEMTMTSGPEEVEAGEDEVEPMPFVPVSSETQDMVGALRLNEGDAHMAELDAASPDHKEASERQNLPPLKVGASREPDKAAQPSLAGRTAEGAEADLAVGAESDVKIAGSSPDSPVPVQIDDVDGDTAMVQRGTSKFDMTQPIEGRQPGTVEAAPSHKTKAALHPELATRSLPEGVLAGVPDGATDTDTLKPSPSSPNAVPVKVLPQPGPLQVVSWSEGISKTEKTVDTLGRVESTPLRKVDGSAMYTAANAPVDGKISLPEMPSQADQKRDAPLKTISISYPAAPAVAEAGFAPGQAPLVAPVLHLNGNQPAPPMASQAPVPVQEVSAQILAHVQSGKPTSMELILAPEELGKIRIHLTPDGDNMRIAIQAERPEAMDLIRRNIESLTAEMRQSGFASTSFSFDGWSGDTEGRQAKKSTAAIESALHIDLDEVASNKSTNNMQSGAGLDLRV